MAADRAWAAAEVGGARLEVRRWSAIHDAPRRPVH
jgi:hypothetical protein